MVCLEWWLQAMAPIWKELEPVMILFGKLIEILLQTDKHLERAVQN
jgi:hypothetical protein